jgi:arsenite methyltransferase
MDAALLEILAAPRSGKRLRLDGAAAAPRGHIDDGWLRTADGAAFPVRNGIPRFVVTEDDGQLQTQRSFGFKWKQRDTYESAAVMESHRRWLAERYGFEDWRSMRDDFASKRRVLDAGCGSGFSSSAWLDHTWAEAGAAEWVGLDISEAIDVARERLGGIARTHFVQGDVLDPPFVGGSFDAIFSEGVLHHTPSTRDGIRALARLLSDDGKFLFYVYRRKGPIREFTDDYVRGQIADLPEAEAWEALRPLTELGQALAELKAEVEVPHDIPLLGIRAGRHDVQRLVYWNMAKLFWNPDWSFEENHHVNFDWYHPRYAHRHTREEIETWCAECGLAIERLCEQDSGFTVVASRG